MKKVKILISGRVQRVGFRYWVKGKLNKLGIRGEVKNLDDGRVAVELEGEDSLVKEMIEKCKEGPPLARVDRVEEVG